MKVGSSPSVIKGAKGGAPRTGAAWPSGKSSRASGGEVVRYRIVPDETRPDPGGARGMGR